MLERPLGRGLPGALYGFSGAADGALQLQKPLAGADLGAAEAVALVFQADALRQAEVRVGLGERAARLDRGGGRRRVQGVGIAGSRKVAIAVR